MVSNGSMPASSIAPENNEAQEYQRALEDATFAVEEISSKIDDSGKLILMTDAKIDELKEELVLARNNIAELSKDLFLARKKVAGIKNDIRRMESGDVVADETIVPRLVSKIKEVLRMISEVEKLGFVTPVTIFMGLAILENFQKTLPAIWLFQRTWTSPRRLRKAIWTR